MMMIFPAVLLLSLGLSMVSTVGAFQSPLSVGRSSSSSLWMAGNNDADMERMKAIMEEESMNAENLKASAQAMKNIKPGDIDQMMAEMDRMPAAQLEQLKKMGMDPSVMKSSLEMMKKNPDMMKSMGEMMEKMTPEELLEQSRKAQEQMKAVSANVAAASPPAASPSAVKDAEIEQKEDEDEEEDDEDEPIEPDEKVLDTMFQAAEMMSEPPTGGVTFAGFCTVPPVAVLSRGTGEDDLDRKELAECWNTGSLGATRVDKSGFKRVWMQVQDNYYGDIMEEARERTLVRPKKTKRGVSKEKSTAAPAASAPVAPPNMVGNAVSAEQLSSQLKNMKDSDVEDMLARMSNMSPAEEARMKAMGVDPGMMRKSAEMMNSNPLLRKAYTTMMKNTSPEQLMKSSQMAQEKLANMSEEEKKKMMDGLM